MVRISAICPIFITGCTQLPGIPTIRDRFEERCGPVEEALVDGGVDERDEEEDRDERVLRATAPP